MMKKLLSLLVAALLLLALGCSDDSTSPEDPVNEFQVLLNHLESGDADYEGWVNNMTDWIVSPPANAWGDSTQEYTDYYILDFRAVNDFNVKHIPDAKNVTLATMFEEADNATKPILAVCYTGQTSAYAHMLLRMKGYEAYSLKFGMSGYAKSLDKWTNNCSSTYVGDPNWVTTVSPDLPEFDYPALNTGEEIATAILDKRINAAIAAWPKLIVAADVMLSPEDFNIINYWGETDYLTLGHIDGSYQVTPKTLSSTANLKAFNPNGENILYCWTGQTAAATIAYLTVLGYDVKSISFGTNAMIFDGLPGHRWPHPYGGP